MNISQHCIVPTCQYKIDPSNDKLLLAGGNTSYGVKVPRYTLYPNSTSFDKRYNYLDFSMLNSMLFYSTISGVSSTLRPFIGFSNDSAPYGPGVYLPYSSFTESNSNLVIDYDYSSSQGADLDSCKTLYVSDGALDAQVRYLFWKE